MMRCSLPPGVDQDRIVGGVGGDPDAGQHARRRAAAGGREGAAERGGRHAAEGRWPARRARLAPAAGVGALGRPSARQPLGRRKRLGAGGRARFRWSRDSAVALPPLTKICVEHLRDLFRVAVAHFVDLDARADGAGRVQLGDPARRGRSNSGLAATTRIAFWRDTAWNFTSPWPRPGLARVHDLSRVRRRSARACCLDRIHADRLAAQPVDVESAHRFQRRLALAARADNQQDPARRIGADGPGTRREALEQLGTGSRPRHIAREHGQPVAGLGAHSRSTPDGPPRRGRDAVAAAVAHHARLFARNALSSTNSMSFLATGRPGRQADRPAARGSMT